MTTKRKRVRCEWCAKNCRKRENGGDYITCLDFSTDSAVVADDDGIVSLSDVVDRVVDEFRASVVSNTGIDPETLEWAVSGTKSAIRVTCFGCGRFEKDDINPAAGLGRCLDSGRVEWPHKQRSCGGHQSIAS